MANAASTSIETGKTMGIFQNIGLAEDGYIQSFKASLGVTAVTKEGGLVTKSDSIFDPSDGVTAMPRLTYTISINQATALADAKSYQAAQAGFLIAQIKSYMVKKGAVETVFYYRQLIQVTKLPSGFRKKAVSWHLMIDSTGRARYSDPKIISDIPEFVHQTYTPLNVDDGLPATWVYPNVGVREYRTVDKLMNPFTGITSQYVGAIWEQPKAQIAPYTSPYPAGCELDIVGEMVCDPDWSIKCMIDKTSNAACPTAFDDVLQLINKLGSDGAYIDYVRTITPVYDEILTGYDIDGEEIYEYIARVSVSVDSRTWIPGKRVFFIANSGASKFNMKARVGYELQKQVDRYFVETDGTYNLVGSQVTQTISPTIDVNKTVSVPAGKRCNDYVWNVIDPFYTNQVFDWRNDTVNSLPQSRYVYVSPLGCF